MKVTKIMLSALFLTMSMGMYAQDETGAEATDEEEVEVPAEKIFYQRVFVGFVGMDATSTPEYSTVWRDYAKDMFFKGGNIGWTGGVKISKKVPLAVEFGGEIAFAGAKDSYTKESLEAGTNDLSEIETLETKVFAVAFKIPVNLTYKFKVSDKLSIAPFVGVNARYNIVCHLKSTYTDKDYENGTCTSQVDDNYTGSIFEENKEGGSAVSRLHTGRRVQLGAQAGVNFAICDHYHIGLAYARNFNKFIDKSSLEGCNKVCKNPNSFAVTVGYNF